MLHFLFVIGVMSMCCKLREADWCLVDSPSSSSASETKRKAPLFAAGSPRPDRRPPSTPFTPLLESLHNLCGLQEVVLCLDPRRRFFVLHLLQLMMVMLVMSPTSASWFCCSIFSLSASIWLSAESFSESVRASSTL